VAGFQECKGLGWRRKNSFLYGNPEPAAILPNTGAPLREILISGKKMAACWQPYRLKAVKTG